MKFTDHKEHFNTSTQDITITSEHNMQPIRSLQARNSTGASKPLHNEVMVTAGEGCLSQWLTCSCLRGELSSTTHECEHTLRWIAGLKPQSMIIFALRMDNKHPKWISEQR